MAAHLGTHNTYFLVRVETSLDVRESGTRQGQAVYSATVVGEPEVTTYLLPTDVGEKALAQFEAIDRRPA